MKQIKKLMMILLCFCAVFGIYTLSVKAAETDEISETQEMESEIKKCAREALESNKFPSKASSSNEEPELIGVGHCGENVLWGMFDDGILVITGNGYMRNYTRGSVAPWAAYSNYIYGVLVSDGVLNIGNHAFDDCANLSIVVMLDNGVQSIGDYAFCNEVNLEEVSFPNTLKKIGERAFSGCMYIAKLSIPDSVTSIGKSAFDNCDSLKSVKLPSNLKAIPDLLFYQCIQLRSVTIPEGVRSIGSQAFDFTPLRTVTIPNGVKTIGSCAFARTKLTSITLPDTVTTVGENAFEHCTMLTKATLSENLTAIPDSMFKECRKLESVAIQGNKVKSIGQDAFFNCEKMTSVNLPKSLTMIGKEAFRGCYSLKKVTIPEKVKVIPCNAFYGCLDLESLTISYGVTTIDSFAFEYCGRLKSVRFPKTVKTISFEAFNNCTNLEKVTILNEEAEIQAFAFGNEHSDNFTIRCLENSTAHTYALKNKIPFELIDLSLVTEYFGDVAPGAWYTDAVQYVYDKGIMEGTNDTFTPNGNMTRAMFVTTLYRLAGEPVITDHSACEELKDVASEAWYTDAVCWAYANGITTGYVDTQTFGIKDPLTREQLAAFLYRYAQYSELDTTQTNDLSGLLNADQIKEYAVDNVKWAVGAGLISGLKTTDETGATVYDLAPQGKATRAQMASILMRFCEAYHLYEETISSL